MPRRMIDPGIWRNERVGNLPDAGRLLFIGIFSNADDDGRLKGSPRFLKATIFPYDNNKTDDQIRELRDKCEQLGLIRVYSKNGQEYLDLPGWGEHQRIRRDRHNPSKLPSYDDIGNQLVAKHPPSDNQMTTIGQPSSNHPATNGDPSSVQFSSGKSSTPEGERRRTPSPSKETETAICDGEPSVAVRPECEHERGRNTPGRKQKDLPDPRVREVLHEMKQHLGYPDVIGTDPIPNYGKEGQAIKRMLARGFAPEDVIACWKEKVDTHGGDFVSMHWVNEDIGKKGGSHGTDKRGRRGHWSRELPKKYTPTPNYPDL